MEKKNSKRNTNNVDNANRTNASNSVSGNEVKDGKSKKNPYYTWT